MQEHEETFFPEFLHLCEAAVEETLTPDELARFESLVRSHDDLRRYYVDFVQQHMALFELYGSSRFERETDPVRLQAARPPERRFRMPRGVARRYVLPCLLLLCVLWFLSALDFSGKKESAGRTAPVPGESVGKDRPRQTTFGEFVEKTPCVWNAEYPRIDSGARIGPCEFQLVEGIAQICFDNGVKLYIEGPTHLALENQDRCFLHSGKVLAQVSEQGVGFTVDTLTASIEDRGTEFGVQVTDGKSSEVQVFQGHVDVRPSGREQTIPLTTGKRIRFSDTIHDLHDFLDQDDTDETLSDEEGITRSTNDGAGKEASVTLGDPDENATSEFISHSETFTLVKNAFSNTSFWNRKAYFTIDLSDVSVARFDDVELELTFAHTGIGFLSRTSKVVLLSVYGLTDEQGDSWTEDDITWQTAPANKPGPTELDLDKVMMLGQITISSDQVGGVKTVSGSALRRFIEKDTNRLLTFIVVCETKSLGRIGYAYGFANRHHPELRPPTLRFFVGEAEEDPDAF